MIVEIVIDSVFVAGGYILGGISMWWVMRFNKGPPGLEHVRIFMSRVVNDEELEEHRKIRRTEMVRAGRKTMRVDGGANAKMLKMRVRRGPRRVGR